MSMRAPAQALHAPASNEPGAVVVPVARAALAQPAPIKAEKNGRVQRRSEMLNVQIVSIV